MKLIACMVLLIGYGILTRLYYKEKKYVMASIWGLLSICILYLMFVIYLDEY